MLAADEDEDVMANYFHIALKGSARFWFLYLAPKSIRSRKGLCLEFLINFQGMTMHPGTQFDLGRVVQRKGETLQ